MTFGQCVEHPSLSAFVDLLPKKITRESLHLRFTDSAVLFLQACLALLFRQTVKVLPAISTTFFNHFRRILLWDSTSWDIHPLLSSLFPGSGGSASAANAKIQTCFDVKHGRFANLEITPGSKNDLSYTHTLPTMVAKNDLILFDLGYFCIETLFLIHRAGAFFLTRFLGNTSLYSPSDGERLDLRAILSSAIDSIGELPVVMGQDKKHHFLCRFIYIRVPDEVAEKRRRKLLKEAQKKGRTPKELCLFLASWTLLITTIDPEILPAGYARQFYYLRWQIELIFKQFKSVFQIHQSSTANQYRLQCEIYGKLILLSISQAFHGSLNSMAWNSTGREVSSNKVAKRIKQRAFLFMKMMSISLEVFLIVFFEEMRGCLLNCLMLTQKSRQSTLQQIASLREKVYEIS
jgi:hypothetical protein